MSSNSSLPLDEKNFPAEDSAGVPIVSVTAELPVHVPKSAEGGGGEPAAATPALAETPVPEVIGAAASGSESELSGGEHAANDHDVPSPFAAEAIADRSDSDELRTAAAFERLFEAAPAETGANAPEEAPIPQLSPDVLTSATEPLPEPGVQTAESVPAAEPAETALEFDDVSTSLDASDLVIEGDEPTPGPTIGQADEEFLRRVVLPPVPKGVAGPRHTIVGMPVMVPPGLEPTDDHTVVSGPPSPELLAAMTGPRAPAAAPIPAPQGVGEARGSGKGVRLSYPQLGALVIGAAALGSVLTGFLLPPAPAPLSRAASLTTTAIAPERAAPVKPAAPTPPAPAVSAKAAEPVAKTAPATAPSAPATAPSEPRAASPSTASSGKDSTDGGARASKPSKAKREGKAAPKRSKRTAKKAFVDPFE